MIGKRSSGTPEAAHARTTAQAGNDTAAQASTSRDQHDELEDGELTVVSETAGVDDVVVVDKVEESDVFSALIADAGRLQPTAAGSEASGGGHLAAAVAASGDRRHPRRNQKQVRGAVGLWHFPDCPVFINLVGWLMCLIDMDVLLFLCLATAW